jgi:uncharacterized membrane protein YdfJ with MMPL/SSD domain
VGRLGPPGGVTASPRSFGRVWSDSTHPEEASVWGRIGRRIQRRPRLVWTLTVLLLAVMAIGLVDTRTGLNQDQMFRGQPASVVGQRLLAASFPSGATAPVSVVARAAATPAVLEAVRTTPGIAAARPSGRAGDLVEISATETATPPATVRSSSRWSSRWSWWSWRRCSRRSSRRWC